ncbi:hypothetical protein [Pseudomonas serbica]|uniref:hypothetical protein n=1 Tax=Pseudomonas serbica TaxID=2965074 RepID=UPI00237A7D3C|nr:hypothetical protein [Pseudomonas serbica]
MKSMIKLTVAAMSLAVLAGCAHHSGSEDSASTSTTPTVYSKPGIPAELSGVWVGAEYTDEDKQPRPLEIDLRLNDLGRVEYKTPGCSGLVKYQRHEGQAMVLLEQIESGVGSCPRNSYLRLEPNPDGSMRYAHFDLEGKRIALGQVRKSSQVSRTVDKQLDPRMLGTWSGTTLTHDGRKTRAEVTITQYGRSQALYQDLGCITELRHGAGVPNGIAMMETPIKGNASTCVNGIVTYILHNGQMVRMSQVPGKILNTTYLNKTR